MWHCWNAIDVVSPGFNYIYNTHGSRIHPAEDMDDNARPFIVYFGFHNSAVSKAIGRMLVLKRTTPTVQVLMLQCRVTFSATAAATFKMATQPLIRMQLTLRCMIFTRVRSLIRPYCSSSSLTWTNHLS
jgi:hypothetical protein